MYKSYFLDMIILIITIIICLWRICKHDLSCMEYVKSVAKRSKPKWSLRFMSAINRLFVYCTRFQIGKVVNYSTVFCYNYHTNFCLTYIWFICFWNSKFKNNCRKVFNVSRRSLFVSRKVSFVQSKKVSQYMKN